MIQVRPSPNNQIGPITISNPHEVNIDYVGLGSSIASYINKEPEEWAIFIEALQSKDENIQQNVKSSLKQLFTYLTLVCSDDLSHAQATISKRKEQREKLNKQYWEIYNKDQQEISRLSRDFEWHINYSISKASDILKKHKQLHGLKVKDLTRDDLLMLHEYENSTGFYINFFKRVGFKKKLDEDTILISDKQMQNCDKILSEIKAINDKTYINYDLKTTNEQRVKEEWIRMQKSRKY